MRHTKRDLLIDRQSLGRTDGILDLSSIQVMLGHLIKIAGREDSRLDALDFLDFGEKHGEDAALGFEGQLAVFEAEVDAGLEGRVEVFHAVGGEEEDALEVFEQAQEDADEGVAVDVLGLCVMSVYESYLG